MIRILQSSKSPLSDLYIGTETPSEAKEKLKIHNFSEVASFPTESPIVTESVLAEYYSLNDKHRLFKAYPFYNTELETAVDLLKSLLAKHLPAVVKKARRECFTFDNCNIPIGSIITHIKTNKSAMVVWNNKVLLAGSSIIDSLNSASIKEHKQLKKHKGEIKIANAKTLWSYNGETLNDIYERMYGEV